MAFSEKLNFKRMLNSESTIFFHQSFIFFTRYFVKKKLYKNADLADYLGPDSVTKKTPPGNSLNNKKENFREKNSWKHVNKRDFLKIMNLKLALSPLLLTLFLINLISLVKDYY